jgi:glyoxylase-like metal-dependent hydrolase (beta-lactamase superfamily II)
MGAKPKYRRLVLLGIAALILGGTVALSRWWPASAPAGGYGPPVPNVVLAPRPTALGLGLYLLGRNNPGAAYAVRTSDGLVLVDSGIETNAALVTEQLRELGLDPGSLRAILLTHGHADHVLGAEHLRSTTGARIYAGRRDTPPLRAGAPREAFLSTFYMPDLKIHPTTVDVELSDGDIIDVGDTHFQAIAAPGHTPGCICFQMERSGKRILFTGDVVQSLGDDARALGTYSAYMAPKYRGNAGDYLATLRKLLDLPPPDVVLPGHPRRDMISKSPYVSEARWKGYLGAGITAMEDLLARRARDGANFLDDNPKELAPGLRYLGDIEGRALYCLNTPKGLFLFDAPGGKGLVEFLSARLKEAGLAGRWPTAVLLTSADPASTAGLSALVAKSGCKVLGPRAGRDAVRRACSEGTEVLNEDAFGMQRWFDATLIPLSGRGSPALAYRFTWAEKSVLVSGRYPIKLGAEAMEQLMRDVGSPGGSVRDYRRALDQLLPTAPDLWLPSVPVQSQNANLYDDEWRELIARNDSLFS